MSTTQTLHLPAVGARVILDDGTELTILGHVTSAGHAVAKVHDTSGDGSRTFPNVILYPQAAWLVLTGDEVAA